MGKKLKFVFDLSLARPHASGSSLALAQPALHEQLGEVDYLTPKSLLKTNSSVHVNSKLSIMRRKLV